MQQVSNNFQLDTPTLYVYGLSNPTTLRKIHLKEYLKDTEREYRAIILFEIFLKINNDCNDLN